VIRAAAARQALGRVRRLGPLAADGPLRTAVRRLLSNRKVRMLANGASGLLLLGVAAWSVRHVVRNGWPLHHADPALVVGSSLLYLAAYAFKAWGWQRLFHAHERPAAGALAFAGGAACVGGIALPGRIDDAIRIAVVKRYPGTRAGLGTLGLSLIVLWVLDNAALTPFASVAAADARSWSVRAGFVVVAAAGIAAAAVVATLPRLLGRRGVLRFRLGRWLAAQTHCTKEAWAAWLLVSVSWSLRGTAVFLLLDALSVARSFPLALAFLCASAASAALPIAPAGAATQAGAGAAILALSGVATAQAIAFSVAAQALVIVTGAAVVLLIAAWHVALRLRPRPAPAASGLV
jgi:Lysylphosphatidylglycerol synthase TM region